MKSKTNKSTLVPALILITLILLFLAIFFHRSILASLASKTGHSTPEPSVSSQPHAGAESKRNLVVEKPTQTPTPSVPTPSQTPTPKTITTPIGQVLNKSVISLSASDNDLEHNGSMLSTVFRAAPQSQNSIVATSKSGQEITVSKPFVANQSGQTNEITWSAKTAGLTPGIWSVQILSQLGSSSSRSSAAELTVNN